MISEWWVLMKGVRVQPKLDMSSGGFSSASYGFNIALTLISNPAVYIIGVKAIPWSDAPTLKMIWSPEADGYTCLSLKTPGCHLDRIEGSL